MTILEEAARRAAAIVDDRPAFDGEYSLLNEWQRRTWTPPSPSDIGWVFQGNARWSANCPSCGLDAEWRASEFKKGEWKRVTYHIDCPTEACRNRDVEPRQPTEEELLA